MAGDDVLGRLDERLGALALAVSVYVVYFLEIVKLANPYVRRREQAVRERRTA